MENLEFPTVKQPMEYLKIFFRRKWLLIFPVFAGLILSIVACFLLPPTYESSTVILVEDEKIINPLIQDLAVSTTAIQRMQTIKEIILGWNSLVELTRKLNLARNVQTQAEFEGLILGLRKNINVQMRGQNLIRIAYYGRDKRQTQLVARTLTDILIDENMRSQTKQTDVAIDFIKDQLELYKRKIKESEIAKMEDELKGLLLDSTEEHPLVRELRLKIAAARKEMESEEHEASETEAPITSPAYKAIEQEIDRIVTNELEPASGSLAYAGNAGSGNDPNAAIYKVLLMDKLGSALSRDMRVNENIYNMLLQKLETAKITQRLEVSKEGTRYTVIDPPRLPLRPVKPNKILVIFMGLFLGAGAGVGIVLGTEFMDHSFIDIEDAKLNLELPVLGAISRLTTQDEINKEKGRAKRIIAYSLGSSIVLVITVMLISFFRA